MQSRAEWSIVEGGGNYSSFKGRLLDDFYHSAHAQTPTSNLLPRRLTHLTQLAYALITWIGLKQVLRQYSEV
jgi:hypothetical protein